MLRNHLRTDTPIDLVATLGPLLRGRGDPTMQLSAGRVVRATRTEDGTATVEITADASGFAVCAWGPGAERGAGEVPALLGLEDSAELFRPRHGLIAELVRRRRGLRIGRTGRVLEALVPAILEQKVTGEEARRGFRGLVHRYGEPAPGPYRLFVPPSPERLAGLPYHAFHPLGVERRRADLVRRAATVATRLEEGVGLPIEQAYGRLQAVAGIGPWTAAEVGIRAFGDPDAVSVGDFHLPSLVAWALAGEPRGSDERMLELLEPYRGQRGRVIRLLESSGIRPPRYGPRLAPRSIAGI
jgi:3-methyladenine DNA glycosylase/8-oxoguanine DNA glycosylase